MRKAAPVEPQLQIVTFRVGAVDFALDVFAVHEVLRWEPVTAVPKAPAFVEGVIEVRGVLLPIVDLRRRFEVADASVGAETRILVVDLAGERVGLVVDTVSAVRSVPEASVTDPPGYIRGLAPEYVRGVVRTGGALLILLAIDRVLTSEERIALQEAEWEGADEEGGGPESGGAVPAPDGERTEP